MEEREILVDVVARVAGPFSAQLPDGTGLVVERVVLPDEAPPGVEPCPRTAYRIRVPVQEAP